MNTFLSIRTPSRTSMEIRGDVLFVSFFVRTSECLPRKFVTGASRGLYYKALPWCCLQSSRCTSSMSLPHYCYAIAQCHFSFGVHCCCPASAKRGGAIKGRRRGKKHSCTTMPFRVSLPHHKTFSSAQQGRPFFECALEQALVKIRFRRVVLETFPNFALEYGLKMLNHSRSIMASLYYVTIPWWLNGQGLMYALSCAIVGVWIWMGTIRIAFHWSAKATWDSVKGRWISWDFKSSIKILLVGAKDGNRELRMPRCAYWIIMKFCGETAAYNTAGKGDKKLWKAFWCTACGLHLLATLAGPIKILHLYTAAF